MAFPGFWGGLHIRSVWVKETRRGKGIGSVLLKKVETEAIKKGAVISLLESFDFQAKDFYLNHGNTIFGELNDFPKGLTCYYFSKKLQ